MAAANHQFLLVTVELSGSLAGPALALPHNIGRRLHESLEQSSTSHAAVQSLKSGRMALYLNQRPKDITKGFVFGSDPRTCDVLLATTKSAGISARHFSVNVDWVSRDPMITCLSGNALQVKIFNRKETTILSKHAWERLGSGTTTKLSVIGNLSVALVNPNRRDLQAVYDRNLQGYFLEYKNAVPELANISLDDDEITPLILTRGAGLEGKEYLPTKRILTGHVDYDSKVYTYNVIFKPTLEALKVAQKGEGVYRDIDDWPLNDLKGRQPGELYVVKHFREGKFPRSLYPPNQLRELCHLSHLNLEHVVDLIMEPSVFMVVTATFCHGTLDTLIQNEPLPLRMEEAGSVMGQTFAALKYLHDDGWTHGNLDPRSIRVMSRERLWIKLTDTALYTHFDLGKPDGYHATYASQNFGQADKRPADIWSAGVVALELLKALPSRSGTSVTGQASWVRDLERVVGVYDWMTGSQASAAVKKILKRAPKARPTAADVLNDPWLLETRGALSAVFNPDFDSPIPESSFPPGSATSASSSRQSSVPPLPKFSENSDPPTPLFPQYSDPPLPIFRHGSAAPSELTPAEILERTTEFEKLKGDYNDLDNVDWYLSGSQRSSSVRSQSVNGESQTPAIGWKPGNFVGKVEQQREVDVAEDSGEETETGRREPVTKKPRKSKAGPPHSMGLRSRGNGNARED